MLTAIERIEHDLLGDLAVPAAAYYGVHTLRALENFPITGIPISFIRISSTRLRALKKRRRWQLRPGASQRAQDVGYRASLQAGSLRCRT